MRNLWALAEGINPSGTFAYFDKLQLWLKRPLSLSDLNCIANQCRGPLHVYNQPAKFDRSYRQRLQLKQPSHEALQLLSMLDDVHPNAAEFANDWTFHDATSCDEAYEFVREHHIKRWHRQQGVRFANTTRY